MDLNDPVDTVLNGTALSDERREVRRLLEHESISNHTGIVCGEELLRRAIGNQLEPPTDGGFVVDDNALDNPDILLEEMGRPA